LELFGPTGRRLAEFRITSGTRGVSRRIERAIRTPSPELRALVDLLQELAGPAYVAEFVAADAQVDVEDAGWIVGDLLRSLGISPPTGPR
jgi:hypothetical protein